MNAPQAARVCRTDSACQQYWQLAQCWHNRQPD